MKITGHIIRLALVFTILSSFTLYSQQDEYARKEAGRAAIAQDHAQYGQWVKEWRDSTTKKNLDKMTAGMQCKDASQPFLTDKIIVSNDLPNLEWMNFKDAYAAAESGKYTVVAYCK